MLGTGLGAVSAAMRRSGAASAPVVHTLDFAAGVYDWDGPPSGSLLAGWSFTRASAGLAPTAAGDLTAFASGQPRITDAGLLYEGARTNKNTNYNLKPTDLTNTSTNTGTPTYTVVAVGSLPAPVQAALAASPLGDLVTGGQLTAVYKVVGTSGDSIRFGGTPGNTNVHTLSVYGYVESGSAQLQFSSGTPSPTTLNSGFARTTLTQAPSSSTRTHVVQLTATSTIYLIGNQMEEAASASSLIEIAGSAATRAADAASVTVPAGDGADTITVTWSGGGPTAFTRADLAVADVLNLSVDGAAPWIGSRIETIALEMA